MRAKITLFETGKPNPPKLFSTWLFLVLRFTILLNNGRKARHIRMPLLWGLIRAKITLLDMGNPVLQNYYQLVYFWLFVSLRVLAALIDTVDLTLNPLWLTACL